MTSNAVVLGQAPAKSPAAAPPAKAPSSSASPPAPAPPSPPRKSPPAAVTEPTDTIKVLLKANRFISFIRLMKSTHVDTQLYSQLNSSTDGITMFAPNDNAFASLRPGSLDALDDREKLAFVQFHILPRFLSTSGFQTLSNPVKTLAGSDSRFPLTITTTDNSVTISTGIIKTSVVNTVYTDKQVAIYEVSKVLIPKDLFPPPPASAPAKLNTESPVVPAADASGGAMRFALEHYNVRAFLGVATLVGAIFGL
ncbi:hypothetical protein Tsubulata_024518 [Turnera subulata]|uniref:FAS1 domain-containing protein n=1 Tax=Turnera subulata TaxID=218843 RepID=A0A9Q0FD02_9ROSI|nr:hypothetical protein Tsubulata_024518 [Turnera subulata]